MKRNFFKFTHHIKMFVFQKSVVTSGVFFSFSITNSSALCMERAAEWPTLFTFSFWFSTCVVVVVYIVMCILFCFRVWSPPRLVIGVGLNWSHLFVFGWMRVVMTWRDVTWRASARICVKSAVKKARAPTNTAEFSRFVCSFLRSQNCKVLEGLTCVPGKNGFKKSSRPRRRG